MKVGTAVELTQLTPEIHAAGSMNIKNISIKLHAKCKTLRNEFEKSANLLLFHL